MSPSDREMIVADLTAVAVGFVQHAAQLAIDRRFPEILFLTREGEFFLSVFNTLCEFGAAPPTVFGRLVETSRQATYCASLREPSIEEFMRLWRQYSRQSPAAFLMSLGEEPDGYADLLAANGLAPGEAIQDPWSDRRVLSLVSEPEFGERVMAASERQRSALFGYLDQRGLRQRDRILLTDIGWRGTIQDNLCLLMPDRRIVGVYVGLQRFQNPQPPNGEKLAVVGDMNDPGCSPRAATALKFVTAMEMLCASPHGTVTGYGPAPDFKPLREASTPESETWRAFTGAVQAAVIERAPYFARKAARHSPAWRDTATARAFQRLLLSPRRALAEQFAGFVHDERFGDGQWDTKGRRLARGTWRAAFDRQEREELQTFLRGTSWPQGWMRSAGLNALVPAFNLLLQRKVASDDLARPAVSGAIRVLHVTGRSDHGGGPEHVLQLVQGATPETIPYVACPPDGVYWSRYRDIVGSRRMVPIPHRRFDPVALRQLVAFVRRQHINIIHAHGVAGGVYGRLAAALAGVPCAYTFHGVPESPVLYQEFYRIVEPTLARWTTAAIAVSEGEGELILKRYPIYRNRVHVVPNGLDIPPKMAERRSRAPDAPVRVISFTRDNRQKNPELVVEIARCLREMKAPAVRFDLYGDGIVNPGLTALIEEAGVPIRCHPPHDNPGALLASADFYLSTSRWEGMPMSLLEAWRAGTCVVATDVLGNRDVATPDLNGVLFPSEDAEAGARALAGLMNDPSRVDALRRQAFADCAARHGRSVMMERLMAVYRVALGGVA